MTLTKAGLVQQVYKNHDNLTKSQATDSVEVLLRLSKDSLINGSDLLLSGFAYDNICRMIDREPKLIPEEREYSGQGRER